MSKSKLSAKRICAVCTAAVLIASAFTACGEQNTDVADNNLSKSSSESSANNSKSQKPAESVMGKTVASGKCGENVTYTLDENGTLLISGTGDMYRYMYSNDGENDTPWCSSKNDIVKIIIESGVTNIGENAFLHCKSLESITIPDSVKFINKHAFAYCESLANITIPNSVMRIEENAFIHCKSLESITIPDGVKGIGKNAFAYCESLANITIPDSVTSIGYCAFDHTAWYNNQADGLVYAGKFLYEYKGEMPANTSIEIKDGTLGFADYALNCKSLVNVTIPDSIISIGDTVFLDCESLENITIPDSVTNIEYDAFEDCNNLTIHAPKGSFAEEYANGNNINNNIKFVAL